MGENVSRNRFTLPTQKPVIWLSYTWLVAGNGYPVVVFLACFTSKSTSISSLFVEKTSRAYHSCFNDPVLKFDQMWFPPRLLSPFGCGVWAEYSQVAIAHTRCHQLCWGECPFGAWNTCFRISGFFCQTSSGKTFQEIVCERGSALTDPCRRLGWGFLAAPSAVHVRMIAKIWQKGHT